jgi:hypothetical protein
MIISISGKIGSGKDTVGKIICYLIHADKVEKGEKEQLPSLSNYLGNNFYNTSGWEIKKFAGKLKQIASILTGVPEYLFEQQDFKETFLSSEWDRVIIEDKLMSVKEFERECFKENWRYDAKYIQKTSVRQLLQELGTNAIRDVIHPNAWVNALFADYKPFDKGRAMDDTDFFNGYRHTACKHCEKEYYGYKRQYLCRDCIKDEKVQFYPNWIITDTRFPNELEAVKKRGGITIKVVRPHGYTNPHTGEYVEVPLDFHASETALDDAEFDYTIINDSTIDDLVHTVSLILRKEKIIK